MVVMMDRAGFTRGAMMERRRFIGPDPCVGRILVGGRRFESGCSVRLVLGRGVGVPILAAGLLGGFAGGLDEVEIPVAGFA